MTLPNELLNVLEDTEVVGDVDAFMAYVDSGQAALDWHGRMAMRQKELDDLYPAG